MRKQRVLSLCDGMATGKLAFDQLGIPVEYWAIEIDKGARELADHNLPGIIRPHNNLLDVTSRDVLYDWPTFDWVLFGFTCKSLSRQANGSNLDGSSGILFDCLSILTNVKHRSPNVKFLIENVYSMTNQMKKEISKIIGQDFIHIDSGLLSGQARQRLYWTNIDRFKMPIDMMIDANSILEPDGKKLLAWSKSTRYISKDGIKSSKKTPDCTSYIEDRYRSDNKANTLVTGKGCKGPSTRNTVLCIDGNERDLTVREAARLQTIPEEYDFSIVSDNKAYECLGNGWTLAVIMHLIGLAHNE